MPRTTKKKEQIHCIYCNNLLNKDDIYCGSCGKKIEEVKENITNNDTINTDNNISYVNNNSNKNFNLLVVLNIILMVIIVVLIFGNNIFGNKTINSIIRNVDITDEGIAESVAKVYDSVVVVENIKKDTLVGTGTGFVYKKDNNYGYILTNNHVISGGDTIYLTFTNGTREKAKVVGTDVFSDVALLKIDVDKIVSVATIGKSEEARLGDTTFAIGAPLDYQVYSWSVTRGIVSGKNRLVEVSLSNSSSSDYVMKVLQTDTTINPGNSGGPLCNNKGEVIGITNMKLASSSVEGMGFAIPIEDAVKYAEQFLNGKEIERPYLGIAMRDLNSLKNSFFGYIINTDLEEGIYVDTVEKNGSAAKAGLQKGDIITEFDNEIVKSSAYLRYKLYQHKIGDKVNITYYRNNKKNTVKITLTGNNNADL